jgi:hypothetical protein
MSERISQRERMSASLETVRPSSGWLLLFLGTLAGLALSIPLAHLLLGDTVVDAAHFPKLFAGGFPNAAPMTPFCGA